MIVPIGDYPNPEGFRPWVNWALIAANMLIYLVLTLPLGLQGADVTDPAYQEYIRIILRDIPIGVDHKPLLASLTAWNVFVFEHGFKPGAPQVSDLFTSMFMHANFAHLAGNMLFLWIYGDNIEHALGRIGYLLAYLATGVAATLGFAAIAGGSMTPLVGASGAISGVLGLYFWFFPDNQIKLFVFFFPFVLDHWWVSARIVLGMYVVIDNVFPLLFSSGSSVAYGAHLGGFLAGVLLAMAFVARARRQYDAAMDSPAREALERGLQALQEGDEAMARRYFTRALQLDPDPDTQSLAEQALGR